MDRAHPKERIVLWCSWIQFPPFTGAISLSLFIYTLVVPCHHICHPVSLCTLHFILSIPVPMEKNLFPVQNGNSRALVTGRFLFRRPLSGTVFLPTSDTVALSHSLKLLLRPSSSLLPSLSYLDPLGDLRPPPPRLLTSLCC